jgi:thiaminase/transcriptional activator TenA
MADQAGLVERLFETGLPFVEAQLRHPTVQALAAGQLDEQVARTWLEQDYLFLQQEIRVLTRLTWRAPRDHQDDLLRLAWNVIDQEIPHHREMSALFDADLDAAVMAPVTCSYTRWLTEAAADYGTGLTALLSGLWGYSTLGQRMSRPVEPRFNRWVATYQDPGFGVLARRFAQMVEEAGPEPDRALCAFLTGMAHEIAFWSVA